MMPALWVGKTGLSAQDMNLTTISNNLANVSTVGFRAELQAFRAVPVQGSGASTRVYALESTPGYDATPGTVSATGRNLDVAVRGNAWLAVQALEHAEQPVGKAHVESGPVVAHGEARRVGVGAALEPHFWCRALPGVFPGVAQQVFERHPQQSRVAVHLHPRVDVHRDRMLRPLPSQVVDDEAGQL